jgi:hypothetical protein
MRSLLKTFPVLGRPVATSPSTPWNVSPAREKQIAGIFASSLSPQEAIGKAAVALSYERLNNATLQDSRVRDQLSGRIGGFFRGSPQLGSHLISSQDQVDSAIAGFISKTLGESHETLPTVHAYAQRRKAIEKRKPRADRDRAQVQTDCRTYKGMRYAALAGSFYDFGTDQIFIHPAHKNADTLGVSRAMVTMHEVEHRTGLNAGSVLRTLHGWIGSAKMFLRIVDPFTPIHDRLSLYHEEGHALSAEWELLHRTPDHMRRKAAAQATEVWHTFGLDITDLESTSKRELKPLMRKRFGDNPHTLAHLACVFSLYRALQAADRSKPEFLAHLRENSSYNLRDIIWRVTIVEPMRFAKREELLGAMALRTSAYLLKPLLWAAYLM